MSFRDIVLMVDSSSEAGARYAVSIASRFEAHLTAAALIVDPTTSMGFLEASAAFVASSLDKLRIAALTTYQLLRHSRAAGRAAAFGAGWRCAAGRG